MPTEEQERLRRLRDRQLGTRDPLAKQRRQDREIAQKQRRMRESFSFGRMWTDLPRRYRGALAGAIVGLGFLLVAPILVEGTWGLLIGVVAFPFAALVGFAIGRYEDTMEEIKKDLH
jgi:hypothetical protein